MSRSKPCHSSTHVASPRGAASMLPALGVVWRRGGEGRLGTEMAMPYDTRTPALAERCQPKPCLRQPKPRTPHNALAPSLARHAWAPSHLSDFRPAQSALGNAVGPHRHSKEHPRGPLLGCLAPLWATADRRMQAHAKNFSCTHNLIPRVRKRPAAASTVGNLTNLGTHTLSAQATLTTATHEGWRNDSEANPTERHPGWTA